MALIAMVSIEILKKKFFEIKTYIISFTITSVKIIICRLKGEGYGSANIKL
jgi:hypothetical protein